MSSLSADESSAASIEPTQFHCLHVKQVPAVVSWTDESDGTHVLSGDSSGHEHVMVDIHHDPNADTALFKIIANVAYKGKRNKSNVFLYIYPERIDSLCMVDSDEAAIHRLGTSAFSLEFSLSRQSELIVPKGDWTPKNDAARSTLGLLESLSRATTLRVSFPCRALARHRLVTLCEKASLSGCLTTTPDAVNLAKLYGGQGGKVVQSEKSETAPTVQDTLVQAPVTDSPPSYGDLGDSPPPHPSQIRKRRRVGSNNGFDSASQEKTSIEEICRHGFAEIGRRFDRIEKSLCDLTSRLDRVEQLVREHQPRASSGIDGQAQPPSTLDQRIDHVEERVTGVEQKLEVGHGDLAKDVENQMHDVRNEFHDQITIRVDDEVGVAQGNLEDFVKDELFNAAAVVDEAIREKLRDALC